MAHSGKTITFATDLIPQENDTYKLGTDSPNVKKWKIYGNVTGDLTGNAATATTASKLTTSDLGSENKPIYLVSGVATECNTYAGGTAVTLNGTNKAADIASFYAPTDSGTSNYILKSGGSNTAPSWIEVVPVANGGTGVTTEASLKATYGIEYIVGTQTAATNAWTGTTASAALYTGKTIAYYLPYNGNSSSATLNLTLSDGTTTGAKNVRINNTNVTNNFPAATIILLVYDGTYWKVDNYDSNNEAGYIRHFQNASYLKPTTTLYRYQILLPVGDGQQVIPANTTSNTTATTKGSITTEAFSITEPIEYYSATATVSAGNNIDGRYHWVMRSGVDLSYSFNTGTTLTPYKDVYIVAQLVTPTTAVLRNPTATGAEASAATGTGPITQTLPNNEDGYIYIKLGHAYSTSAIILTLDHPIYQYKNNILQPYVLPGFSSTNASNIVIENELTVNDSITSNGWIYSMKDTPGIMVADTNNARMDDSFSLNLTISDNGYHGLLSSGYSNSDKTIFTSAEKWMIYRDNNGDIFLEGNAVTATTATNLSAAPTLASGGTSTVSLEANTVYTLTVGGKTLTFTTPVDNNNYVKQSSSSTNNWRKILLHYKEDATSTTSVTTSTNVTYAAQDISVQPYSGTIRANAYNVKDNVKLQWNSTDLSLDFIFL